MPIIGNRDEQLHTIEARLYPCNLSGYEDKYTARIKTDKTLTVEDICAAAVNRGGVNTRQEELVNMVRAYHQEMAYQLADGYTVSNEFYSITPKIGGFFDSESTEVDPRKNRPNFSFRKLKPFNDLLDKIKIRIEGHAEPNFKILAVIDSASNSKNTALTPGGGVKIIGSKIRIIGPDKDVGLYFVNEATGERIKFSGNFVENTPTTIIFVAPALKKGAWFVEITTQNSGGSVSLKTPRTIRFNNALTGREQTRPPFVRRRPILIQPGR